MSPKLRLLVAGVAALTAGAALMYIYHGRAEKIAEVAREAPGAPRVAVIRTAPVSVNEEGFHTLVGHAGPEHLYRSVYRIAVEAQEKVPQFGVAVEGGSLVAAQVDEEGSGSIRVMTNGYTAGKIVKTILDAAGNYRLTVYSKRPETFRISYDCFGAECREEASR